MKVLWTHNFNPSIPNAGVFMYEAAEGLRALGVDVKCEYIGNLRSPLQIITVQKNLKMLAQQYDIVHAQYGSACAFATAAVDSCPKIVSLRGSDLNIHSQFYELLHWHSRLAKYMTLKAVLKYDQVVTVSQRMATQLQKIIPNAPCFVLPTPIDLNLFAPLDRKGTGQDHERRVLFTAVNLSSSVKRFELAQKAVNIANVKMGNISLQIANGIAHEKMPEYVANCHLILCTSTSEGWPNSIKEALACNVPFVSTDVSDLWKIAEQEPSCRICPPDPEILAKHICEVLAMSCKLDLRKYVLPMNLQNSSEKLLNLYKTLLCKKKK